MIWLPKDGDAIGGATLAAVVGYCPELSPEAADALARRLQEWLESTDRAGEIRKWLTEAQTEAAAIAPADRSNAADQSTEKVSETN